MIGSNRLFVGLFGLWAGSALSAQEVPARTLGAPVPPSMGPFLEVRGIRELSDERVIVLDRMDRKLFLVSLRTGAATQLGRDGDGPGEYRVPISMFALPADTTAVYDMVNPYRFVVYGPDGRPTRPIPIKYPGMSGPPEAADGQGRFYIAQRSVRGLAQRYFGKVVRVDRNSGQSDSLAIVNFHAVTPLRLSSRPGPAPPFTTHEQWAAGSDGRVIILHAEPYRLTLVQPDRSVVEGPPLPAEPVRVSKEHRDEWLADRLRPRVGIFRINGITSYVRRPQRDEFEEPSFPPYLPAFVNDALWLASDGMVWVKRTTMFGAPPTFDVIDRNGVLAFRVHLPERARLVGFGSGTVFIARVSNQDTEFLERYRLP